MTTSIKGRRLPDTILGEFPIEWAQLMPGDVWKVLSRKKEGVPLTPADLQHYQGAEGNLTNTVWGVITPNGLYGMLSIHTVREHPEDNTVSVRPGDGSSNSILVTDSTKSYHGYIEHNVWTEC